MRRLINCVLAVAFFALLTGVFYPAVLAQATGSGEPPRRQNPQTQQTDKKIVDFEADVMRPIKVGDSSALNLLGNVVIHHNGAVITCDSAVRYGDKRMECFKRVVINQGTTFVYGDRADYNGEINIASVYSPIIKVVDEDATLYTYKFEFNTLDKVGMFANGGSMSQQENLLEAESGYYYVDTRVLVGVGEVQISNPDYKLTSDSIAYDLNTNIARFFTKTYIWNSKGEILSAEVGEYHQNAAEYKFTKDAYIITSTQEIWADTLDYNSTREDAVARSNVQMREDEQKVMAFGDYAEYWGQFQNIMLTKEPTLMSFDPSQDTTYISSDTIFLYSIDIDSTFKGRVDPEVFRKASREAKAAQEQAADSSALAYVVDGEEVTEEKYKLPSNRPMQTAGSESGGNTPNYQPAEQNGDEYSPDAEEDNDGAAIDSTAVATADSIAPQPTKAEIKAELKARKEAEKQARAEEKKRIAEEKAAQWKAKQAAREERAAAAKAEKLARKEAKRQAKTDAKAVKRGLSHEHNHEHGEHCSHAEVAADSLAADSLSADIIGADSLLMDSTGMLLADSLAGAELTPEEEKGDSLQRVMVAYYDVRIFGNSMQGVCDSLIGFSKDSTLHMYVDPILWSQGSQIMSEKVDVYAKNEQLHKAVFSGGSPLMASKVYEEDTTMFNQVKGKTIEAYFRDNDLYKVDVLANAQNVYYMVDEKTGELNGFMTVECSDITFSLTDRQMEKVTWRGSPVYANYPADDIPGSVQTILDGFEWREDRKPELKDVFKRAIRPSVRAAYEAMPQPQFPITEKINKDREDKIKRRIWTERNDRLSQEAVDFVKSATERPLR